jgi:predicted SAM-dependent methyltransferase
MFSASDTLALLAGYLFMLAPQLACDQPRIAGRQQWILRAGLLPDGHWPGYNGVMDQKLADTIAASIDRGNILNPANLALLKRFSLTEREEFARLSKTMVLYFAEEAAAVQKAEEDASLAAKPDGYSIEVLNGLNIGCGGRTISPYLQPVDVMRTRPDAAIAGAHHVLTPSAFLATSDNLPFKSNSVDYIVALHMLEHVENPIEVINYWLEIVKPGGGIGIVLPDWRYTWDARNDHATLGHKWNGTPELVKELHKKHWSGVAELEALNTYRFKISFDFVLRKSGTFVPFNFQAGSIKSGHQRFGEGIFLHGS